MNNEIKEILDKCTPYLFGDEVDKILDYITNLQEENKLLRIHLNIMKEEVDNTQDKIDKAIKYIEKMEKLHFDYFYEKQELLKILKGVEYMSEEKLNELFNIIDEGYPSIQEQKIRNYITNLQEENERLNNIINELEKYCNEKIEDYDKHINSKFITDIAREQYEGEKVCFEDMLGKLQELKGSDK